MRKQKKESSSSSSFVLVRCFVVVKAVFKTPPLPVDEGTNDEIERHPPPNVVKVVKVVISLSMSSSVVERGFRVRVLFRKVGKKRGGFLSKMFRVCVCVFYFYFFGQSRGREKNPIFLLLLPRQKNTTLFSLGTNRERERENVVFEEALS